MNAFKFNGIEDIRAFETLLQNHEMKTMGYSRNKFLEFAFLNLDGREDRMKIVVSLFDLRLTYFFLCLDSQNAGAAHNHIINNASVLNPEESILSSHASFVTRIGMLQHQTSLILRARAFWDKWIGAMILIFDAKEYDTFMGARSRKKSFLKIAKKWESLPNIFSNQMLYQLQSIEGFHQIVDQYKRGDFFPNTYLEILEVLINRLDSKYRTAEAHGTGVLRKWALSSKLEMTDPKAHASVWVYNDVNMAMQSIFGYFNDKEPFDFLNTTSYLQSKRGALS